jgi:glycerol-3-phosphate dehydrogenase
VKSGEEVKSEKIIVKNGQCVTSELKIGDPVKRRAMIEEIIAENPSYAELLHVNYPYTIAEIIFAIRHEQAQTVEDLLARRTRLLFLDARVAILLSGIVASLLSKQLGKDSIWESNQVAIFSVLSEQYLLDNR